MHALPHLLQLLCATIEVSLYALLVAASLALLRRAAWAFAQGRVPQPDPVVPPADAPLLTVQLPLRNEAEMVAPLLEAAAAIDWPRDRVMLQVLDDSDDETVAEVDRVAAALRAVGTRVEIVRRADRKGYKAGALALGLSRAEGELVLVLDADFRPEPDLAAALYARLALEPQLAFAQARWSFRNEDDGLLTRLEAAILDALFTIEQPMLAARALPVQFNGTAGLWRKEAIARAGGWDTSDDALTEDLDLSFRAHERGLPGVTLPAVAVSTELPPTMAAFRVQQARWVRGGALTLRAIGRRLIASSSARDALAALGHLLRHARQPLFVAAIVRLLLVAAGLATSMAPRTLGPSVFALAALAVTLYLAAARSRLGRSPAAALVLGPASIALSIGLSPILSRAFLGGLLGRRGGGFRRTPKGAAARRRAAPSWSVALALLEAAAAVAFYRAHDPLGAVTALAVAASVLWVAL